RAASRTIEAVEDGWCRRCISHAMASGSQTVRLRRARAARSAETGFAPGHGGFTAAHGSAFHPCAGTGSIADFALLIKLGSRGGGTQNKDAPIRQPPLALILVGGRSDGPYRGRSRMLFVSRGTES